MIGFRLSTRSESNFQFVAYLCFPFVVEINARRPTDTRNTRDPLQILLFDTLLSGEHELSANETFGSLTSQNLPENENFSRTVSVNFNIPYATSKVM